VSQENAHLTRLTEDLLVLSRARDGALPVHLARHSLRDLLDAARSRDELLGSTGARVGFTAPDSPVIVDAVWFRQAVDNLLSNARRHTPAGGSIDVSADLAGATIRLVVDDTGPGFPSGFADRAFEPFTRARPVEAGGQEGAGLGLAVVDAIARAHGGRAWAQNRAATRRHITGARRR
jgi:two-component system, OmpR family, sensor kinase